jgi:3-methyladenine DNA glycosylase AlkD
VKRRELDRLLAEKADPVYREFTAKVIPGSKKILGVRTPDLRKISKSIMKEDWRKFLEMPSTNYEQDLLRALVTAEAPMDGSERIERTEALIPDIDNWAVCDALCGSWKLDSEETKEDLWHMSTELLGTGEEFPMRVGAVMMLSHFIDGEHIAGVLRYMTETPGSSYYYNMGAGWCLSYCYFSFPELTEKAIFSDTIDPEVRKLAVRKIRESRQVSAEDKERLRKRLAAYRRS